MTMATTVLDVSDLALDVIRVIEAPTALEANDMAQAGRGGGCGGCQTTCCGCGCIVSCRCRS
ncbi:hypothetical protein [Nonomuraea sp. NPDC050202]|jgi:hypothetical protein|uniref:hypothetical protein n=1 Tax=Nonomuraea sp. NPDC050202 TaxID=3155035 RepID=UPI0033DFE039